MAIKKKRICVITGSRAEYGLLRKLIAQIEKDKTLKLQLLVTGSHLEKKYGYNAAGKSIFFRKGTQMQWKKELTNSMSVIISK